MSRRWSRIVPAAALVVLAAIALAAGPANAPALAPSMAQMLPPGTVVDEARVRGGGRLRAPGIEEVPGDGVALRGLAGRRTLSGVRLEGEVTARRLWLGTDARGRDVVARLAAGARTSLAVAAIAAAVAVLLGAFAGLLAAGSPRMFAAPLAVAVDAALSVPRVLLLFLFAVPLGGSVPGIGLAVGLVSWMGVSRVVEAECRALSGRGFVEAAAAVGAGPARVAGRHVLPHLAPIVRTAIPVAATEAVLLEATLSFFGLGAGTDSWGAMIADARAAMPAGWWIAASPGVLVAVTALVFHALAASLAPPDETPDRSPAG